MLDLARVKEHLRIDIDDEDLYLKSLISMSQAYTKEACDNFDYLYDKDQTFTDLADQYMLSLIYERYMSRDAFIEQKKAVLGSSYLLRSMITQLQFYPIPKTVTKECE